MIGPCCPPAPVPGRGGDEFDDEGRRGADRILNGDGTLRHYCLTSLVLGRLAAVTGNGADDLFPQVFAELGADPGGPGNGLAGGVVDGGAQAAGGDDDLGRAAWPR